MKLSSISSVFVVLIGTLITGVERAKGLLVLFSEKFNILKTPEDDWLDVSLAVDTNLSVDPFLMWEYKSDAFWGSAHNHLIDFFDMVFSLVRSAKGDRTMPEWKRAADLLIFPEPAEFCLGVSEGSILGAGSNKKLQSDMMSGLDAAFSAGLSKILHMEAISLFQGGIGMDRVGDIVCNVLKGYFIEYTKDVCARHGIPTKRFRVKNASWSIKATTWLNEYHELPCNRLEYFRGSKLHYKELPVLLTPEKFLREMPVASPDGHWRWAWSNMGEELRRDFNFDIASRVDRKTKSRMAQLHPESVVMYLGELEGEQKNPYPVAEDPKLLVKVGDQGKGAVESLDDPVVPKSRAEFEKFVDAVVERYKHGIENQDSWYLLWDQRRGRGEQAAQVLFRTVAVNYCRVADVDLTGEANAGRGPVDFKFSQGWSARALIEVKLARSSKLWDGVLAQQPKYQIAEGVEYGIFLVLAYTDDEYTAELENKLAEAASISSRNYGFQIRPVLVDARKKKSASNEHDPEASGELHGSNEVDE